MAQHLLIADLAAPLLLVGLRNPVLVFLLPRDVLVPLARRTRLRRAFRFLRQPLVAIPVYVLVLYGWHFAPLFEAAVAPSARPRRSSTRRSSASAMLVWWSVLEPKRRRLRGELWKIVHIVGARMLGMMLGMAFVLIRTPVYTGVYGSGDAARPEPRRRPADRRRDDGRARHPDHALRARATSSGAPPSSTTADEARARAQAAT